MRDLLAKARARVVRHLVLDKGALAVTIGMGALIALLLAGTQILNWYWPLLLAIASLGVGLYQLRRHVPTRYQLAQRIDHRMHLADALSTAVYFSEHPRPGLEKVCTMQYQTADRLAAGVNAEHAVPFERSRYLIPATVLFVVASALFVTRYLVIGSLDLNQSLVAVAADNFFRSPPDEDAKAPKLDPRPHVFDPSQPTDPNGDEPAVILPPDAEKSQPLTPGKEAAPQNGGDQSKKADQKGDGKSGSDDDAKDKGGDQGKDQSQQDGNKGQQSSEGDDRRSMFDKLRDAVSNLMNKMGSSDGDKKGTKAGDKQSAKEDSKQGKSEKGDDQDQSAQSDLQQDSTKQGESGKPQEGKQSKAPGQQPSDAQNGAGANEGKKDLAQAEAEKAMGKLSELMGQRAAEIKGQVMVEVTSTKQTLRTSSVEQQAGHTDSGGEIHRDQVPLGDQAFVERYFAEIRKPGATASASAEKSADLTEAKPAKDAKTKRTKRTAVAPAAASK